MDENDLLTIKYLSMFKNITKTANALFISQPALTRRIKNMEKELNTHLIVSNNKGVELTTAGKETVTFATQILQEIEQFKKKIEFLEKNNSQIIRLCAPAIICEYYLPSIVRTFKKKYPNVKFIITVAPSSEVVSLMNTDKCTFGFVRNDFGWNKSNQLLLGTNYIVAASTTPFSLKDLAHMNRVAYTTDEYYIKMLDLWWNNNFNTPPHIDVQVNSLDLCCEMVFNGNGFGILPSVLVPDNPNIHCIILKDKSGDPIQRHTYLVYKKEILDDALFFAFFKFMKEHKFSTFLHLRNLTAY
ncbi:LysR family transcriptional regulator [Acidaminococcus sp. DS4831]|uniref:LysR family transcriptional regulator n=1 Tax=Acidaminococcus sp. DS4831 TaxID=3141399 RepID=UPI0032E4327D